MSFAPVQLLRLPHLQDGMEQIGYSQKQLTLCSVVVRTVECVNSYHRYDETEDVVGFIT